MKSKFMVVALFLFLALAAFNLRAGDSCTSAIKTEAGLVRGLHEAKTNTCVWRGIPYAAAPVGDLRWKAPQPPEAWTGIRTMDQWGSRCMQAGIMEYANFDPSGEMSEDCLFLNIWRPDKPGKFPVMFWIYGGGYTGGTGNMPTYWGDRMAQAGDVVVVTFNYRMNVFGFLALPALRDEDPNQSVGSYGSLDEVAALKWVHNNIARFGGDPDNVTIFGESAGGWSVCSLLASPLARGLFAKAISQSGGCVFAASLEKGYAQGRSVAEQFNCSPDDLQCLRAIPAKKLVKTVQNELDYGYQYYAHIDGYFLTDTPLAVIRSGNFNNVPMIGGFNADEARILAVLDKKLSKAKPEQYQQVMASSLLGLGEEHASRLAELYPLDAFGNSPEDAYGQIASDGILGCPGYLGLAAVAGHQKEVYLYRFEWHNIPLGKTIRAVHTIDLPFVFNSLDRRPFSLLLKNREPYKEEMESLSRAMQESWLNFAKTGNPNHQGVAPWPVFQSDNQKLMVFDADLRAESFGPELQARCEFWDEYSKTHDQLTRAIGGKKEGAK